MSKRKHPSENLPRRGVAGIASSGDMDVLKRNFLARWTTSLRCRLRPRTTLEVKQFAAAIGVRYETALRWLRGDSGPSGDAVAAAVAFFDGRGDTRFRDELFPAPGEPLASERERDQQRAVNRFLEELGVAQARRFFWFTPDREMHAVESHAKLARSFFANRELVGDPSVAALRAGWISVSESPMQLRIRYEDGAPIADAVPRLIDWLWDHEVGNQRITRSVLAEQRWIEVDHPSISSLIQSLSDVATMFCSAVRPTQPRIVRRRSIDDLPFSLASTLSALQQTDGTSESLIQFTFNLLNRDHVGLHRIEGEEVRLAFSGDAIIGRLACALGRDIRERADVAYAMPVRDELLTAASEQQPAYYERQVSINGIPHHYHNLKYASRPDAAGVSFVLTASLPTDAGFR